MLFKRQVLRSANSFFSIEIYMSEDKANKALEAKLDKRRLIKPVVISLLGSIALLAGVAWNADWKLLKASLSSVSPLWLARAAVCLAILQFVNGIRLALLVSDKKKSALSVLAPSIEVSFLCQALIRVLPFRLGDLAFFVIANRKLNTSFEKNLGLFFRIKLWDLRVVATSFLICGGWVVAMEYASLKPYVVGAALLSCVLFMLSPVRILYPITKLVGVLALLPGLGGFRHFSELLERSISSLKEEKHSLSEWILMLLTSAGWCIYYGTMYCLMQGLGMSIDLILAIAVASGMILISIVPIQTIGGFGLTEIGQSSLYLLGGLSTAEATSRSLAVSVLFLGLCLGVPALFWFFFTTGRIVTGWSKKK
jgi:uncharacterized membrane protein YbhN (UPF0104 family)